MDAAAGDENELNEKGRTVMKTQLTICAFLLVVLAISGTQAQAQSGTTIPVTTDNFTRAETDMYFAQFAKRTWKFPEAQPQ
jgi:hypothetical protein